MWKHIKRLLYGVAYFAIIFGVFFAISYEFVVKGLIAAVVGFVVIGGFYTIGHCVESHFKD